MVQRHKICRHCRIKYMWVESGCVPAYNDECYCPECKKAIVDALSKIPEKAGFRWVACTQFSREEFMEALNKIPEDIHMRWPGMASSTDQQIVTGGYISGTLYRATWWKKGSDPEFLIEKEEYYEFKTNDKSGSK